MDNTPMDLKKFIREIPDFPKPGILFYDITTLLKEASAFGFAVEKMAEYYAQQKIDYVVGIEARGFIFGGAVAYLLGVGFLTIRKPNKLPARTISVAYDLEYGEDRLEIHADSFCANDRILVIDDLLATGGTIAAAIHMLTSLHANIVGLGFLLELPFLKARERLPAQNIYSLVTY